MVAAAAVIVGNAPGGAAQQTQPDSPKLTNSDSGAAIRGPLLRKLLEVMFDGKPEADNILEAGAAQRKAPSRRIASGWRFRRTPRSSQRWPRDM